jgi:aspartate racemase
MKTIGLIGGTTWLSTAVYYKLLNEKVNKNLGGASAARLVLHSVNFEEFRELVNNADSSHLINFLIGTARKIEASGAGCLVICANTPHKYADKIQESISIPLIHIGEATAKAVSSAGINSVALLGTKVTMKEDFIKDKIRAHGTDVIVPDEEEMDFINSSIFDELARNIFSGETRSKYIEVIQRLARNGAEGVIFGCTEIPLLIKPEDISIPSFDTIDIHTGAIVNYALSS